MCSDKHRFGKAVEDIKDAYFVDWDENPNWWMMPIITIAKSPHYYGLYQWWSIIHTSNNRCQCLIKGGEIERQVCHIFKELSHFSMNVLQQSLSLPQMISLILLPMPWSEETVTWTLKIWPWVMLRVMIVMRKVILNSHSIRNMGTSNVHQVYGSHLTTNLLLMCSSILHYFQTFNHHQQIILALPPWPWWVNLLGMEPSGSILLEKQTSSLYLTSSLNLKWHTTATAATSSLVKIIMVQRKHSSNQHKDLSRFT